MDATRKSTTPERKVNEKRKRKFHDGADDCAGLQLVEHLLPPGRSGETYGGQDIAANAAERDRKAHQPWRETAAALDRRWRSGIESESIVRWNFLLCSLNYVNCGAVDARGQMGGDTGKSFH